MQFALEVRARGLHYMWLVEIRLLRRITINSSARSTINDVSCEGLTINRIHTGLDNRVIVEKRPPQSTGPSATRARNAPRLHALDKRIQNDLQRTPSVVVRTCATSEAQYATISAEQRNEDLRLLTIEWSSVRGEPP
ncbi:hypothetical protein AB1N83_005110 [Pleurotus pulmonarius]